MSYEGFVRRLCANGHQRTFDCYEAEPEACSCGAAFVWSRSVDETNGYEPEADPPLKLKDNAVLCKCPSCGIVHEREEATYEIPVSPR